MLKQEIAGILEAARERGWVLEPEAKRLFTLAGFEAPRSALVRGGDEAAAAAAELGYPLVAKVVSPAVLHKTEVAGVAVGIESEERLRAEVERLGAIEGCEAVLVEQMVRGIELIVGGKIDRQFGPVVLLGLGGVGVEIYSDTAIRMAPLEERDVESMIAGIRGGKILDGYRGQAGVDRAKLAELVTGFSRLLMEMQERIESIDLNPVICTPERCIIADARIMLAGGAPARKLR